MVDEDESGRCFAIISASETVSDLFGVVFFTRLYYIGLSYPNGRPLPFIVMATLHVALLAIAIYINHGVKQIPGQGALNAGGYDNLEEESNVNPEDESRSRSVLGSQGSSVPEGSMYGNTYNYYDSGYAQQNESDFKQGNYY